MSISKNDFKKALREVVSYEFSHIPCNENEIDITFSKRFTDKMDKLIKEQRKPYYSFINTTAKRVAIIFTIILILLTTACSVDSIYKPILRFIKEVYETFTHYSIEGKSADIITTEYSPTYIPEGYKQTKKIENDAIIITEYINSKNSIIKFKQTTTEYSAGYYVDNEVSITHTENVNNIEVKFKKWNDMKSAIWINNGYAFIVDFNSDIDIEVIKEIIKSVN